jgi:hypothetical protein
MNSIIFDDYFSSVSSFAYDVNALLPKDWQLDTTERTPTCYDVLDNVAYYVSYKENILKQDIRKQTLLFEEQEREIIRKRLETEERDKMRRELLREIAIAEEKSRNCL